MERLTQIAMVPERTVAAITFDRKNPQVIKALSDGVTFTIRRQDNGERVTLNFDIPYPLFCVEETENDMVTMQSHTKSFWRTRRLNGESIVIHSEFQSDVENIESSALYVLYMGDDEFYVYAEDFFRYKNILVTPSSRFDYNSESLHLPEVVVREAERISQHSMDAEYSPKHINQHRRLILELDEMLSERITQSLYAEAKELRNTLAQNIEKLKAKSKKHVDQIYFSKVRQENLLTALKEFIIERHGGDAYAKIERDTLQKTVEQHSEDQATKAALLSSVSSTEQDLKHFQKLMEHSPVQRQAESFISEPTPPRTKIFRCKKCSGFARMSSEQKQPGKKTHQITCTQCQNTVKGSRIGQEVIFNWNLKNHTGITYKAIGLLDVDNLPDEAARDRLHEYQRYCDLKSKEISLTIKATGQNVKVFNKVKGMLSVLRLCCYYYLSVMDGNEDIYDAKGSR